MWPFKRERKSARKNLRQVYLYPDDYMTVKILSKQKHRSMTQVTSEALKIYCGYQYGVAEGEKAKLEAQLLFIAEGFKKARAELKLYKERFGKIEP